MTSEENPMSIHVYVIRQSERSQHPCNLKDDKYKLDKICTSAQVNFITNNKKISNHANNRRNQWIKNK